MYLVATLPLIVAASVVLCVWWMKTYRFPYSDDGGHYRKWGSPVVFRHEHYFFQKSPSGGIGVEIIPFQYGKHLDGCAIVNIYKYGGGWEALPRPRAATYFREYSRKHWWQFWRFPYVEDVAENRKRWVEKRVRWEKKMEEIERCAEERAKELEIRARGEMEKFHSPSRAAGALSKAEDIGGEMSIAQGGMVSLIKKDG